MTYEQPLSDIENISRLINAKKIQYQRLGTIFQDFFPKNLEEKQFRNINIFIDVQSLLKQLYNPEVLESLSYTKQEDRIVIASEILNLIGHYRHYFASRHQMFTTFFLSYSSKQATVPVALYPEYKKEYYEKRNDLNHPTFGALNKIVRYSLQICKTFLNYVPNAYFLDTGGIDPSVIPTYIMKTFVKDEDYNLILTNDETHYQDLLLKDKVGIVEMRGSEKSVLITRENIWDHLLKSTKKSVSDFPHLHDKLIWYLDPMISHKTYGLSAIGRKGAATGLALLNKVITAGELPNVIGATPMDVLEAGSKLFTKEEDKLAYNLHAQLLNHEYQMNMNYQSLLAQIDNQFIDLSNNAEIMKSNEDIFWKFPVRIDYVFESEIMR